MTAQPETRLELPAHGPAQSGAAPFRPSSLSRRNQAARAIWSVVWILLFRPSPRFLYGWRRFLLRLFGARLGRGAVIHASARIFAPWNLVMGEHACLSHLVDCYCVDQISIGAYATVSQYSFLCSASHDHRQFAMPLITKPIEIGAHAWIAADVFVAPGVVVGEGAMVQARSTVMDDVPAWTIVAGHPATKIRDRVMTGFIPAQ
jgi:putative colanic acid biosynthesis acetyltransferase WcaF